VDLDGDGHVDILSGSWPGELFLFRGTADGSFAAPEMLEDKDGRIINIGGGIREDRFGGPEGGRTMTLIAGSAEWERTDEGTFVIYRGRRIESTPEKPIATTGTASTVHPVDWDGDGVIDLIVGDIRGNVSLIPNEGTPTSWAFGAEKPIAAGDGGTVKVNGQAAPFAADWDGDGLLDLLVGAEDGSVWLYRNTGSPRSPKLAAGVQIVPPGERHSAMKAPKEVYRGMRSKVCVADWNGDGRLDLLVGDFGFRKPDRRDPTPEEQAQHDRIRKELELLYRRWDELHNALHYSAGARDPEEREKLKKEQISLREQIRDLQSQLPPEYESYGSVWLFLRK
jgi:hypothetical protein